MNDTVASLVHLYKTAADLERSEQEFQDTLGLLDSLNKPALLTLTRQMNGPTFADLHRAPAHPYPRADPQPSRYGVTLRDVGLLTRKERFPLNLSTTCGTIRRDGPC